MAARDDTSAKTKLFAKRMAYVRETVKNQSIGLKNFASGDSCAVIFTKPLDKTKTQHHFAGLFERGIITLVGFFWVVVIWVVCD